MALDPGGMASGLGRKGDFWLSVVLMKWLLPALGPVMVLWAPNGAVRTAWKSGGDVLRACFEVEVARGEVLYLNGTDEAEVAKDAKDEGKRRALWAYGIKAAGIRGGETALGEWE